MRAAGVFALALLIVGCSGGSPTEATKADIPATSISAATPTTTPTATPESVWSADDGPEDPLRINDMVVDQDGHLWTTGTGGVVRWELDFASYEVFQHDDGMPGYTGRELLTDSEGGVWVRWSGLPHAPVGVSRFVEGAWTHYDLLDELMEEDVQGMAAGPDGRVWFTSSSHIACFHDGEWRTYSLEDGLPAGPYHRPEVSPRGVFWVQTGSGLASFDGDAWVDYALDALADHTVYDMAFPPDGSTFLAADRIYRFDGETLDATPQDFGVGYRYLAVASDGTVWGSGRTGLAAWSQGQWYDLEDDIRRIGVGGLNGELLSVRNGRLYLVTGGLLEIRNWWFGASGAHQITYERLCAGETQAQVLTGTVSIEDIDSFACDDAVLLNFDTPLQMEDGRMLFNGTYQVLVVGENRQTYEVLSYPYPELELPEGPQPGQETFGVQNELWLFDGELYQRREGEWIKLSDEDSRFANVEVIETGPDGRVWVGSRYAVSTWDGAAWEHWVYSSWVDSDIQIRVQALAFLDGDVWVADRERGVSCLEGGDLTDPVWETIELPGWDANEVDFLVVDGQGLLWAGSDSDIAAAYDGSGWGETSPPGVTAMAVDPAGRVWIGVSSQLYVLEDGRWNRFGGSVPNVDILHILVTADGSVWAAYNRDGFVRYSPDGESCDAVSYTHLTLPTN